MMYFHLAELNRRDRNLSPQPISFEIPQKNLVSTMVNAFSSKFNTRSQIWSPQNPLRWKLDSLIKIITGLLLMKIETRLFSRSVFNPQYSPYLFCTHTISFISLLYYEMTDFHFYSKKKLTAPEQDKLYVHT